MAGFARCILSRGLVFYTLTLSLALSSPISQCREEDVGEKSHAQKRRAGEEEEVGEYDRAGDREDARD